MQNQQAFLMHSTTPRAAEVSLAGEKKQGDWPRRVPPDLQFGVMP